MAGLHGSLQSLKMVIYMEKGYIEYNDHYSPYQLQHPLCLSSVENDESEPNDLLKTGRVQLLAIIPNFCLDCPKVGYSIYRDKFSVLCL